MALDVTVTGGTIFVGGELVRGGIGIKDGRIAVIATERYLPEALQTIDASGLQVLPGVIDAHVHTRDPGWPDIEDFETATRSAAVGGVTSIIDMPGTDIPMLRDVPALENKLRVVSGRSYVDFALRGAILDDNLDDIRPLAEAGVVAFKVRTIPKTPQTPIISDGVLLEAFKRVAATGRLVGIHAESGAVIVHLSEQLRRAGRHDALAHYESRPGFTETEAVQRAILLAGVAGARLYIHHIGAADVADHIRRARAHGQDVTGETCPHYLLLSTDDYDRLGTVAKVSPSIKTPADQAGLWTALLDGTIDTIASDHAPHAVAEKRTASVWDALAGFPGVETLLPLMLTEVSRGRLPLARLVDATAVRPARLFGLASKGAIAIGNDADLILVDRDRSWTIEAGRLHTKSRVTPYDGWTVRGRVEVTMVRGMIVAQDGETVGDPRGQWIRA